MVTIISFITGPNTVAAQGTTSDGGAASASHKDNLGHVHNAALLSLLTATAASIDTASNIPSPDTEPRDLPGTMRRVRESMTGRMTVTADIAASDFASNVGKAVENAVGNLGHRYDEVMTDTDLHVHLP